MLQFINHIVDKSEATRNNVADPTILQKHLPFENIKRMDSEGEEFWSARELMSSLGYSTWQNFKNVLLKAQVACENGGENPDNHFMDAYKTVVIGLNIKRDIEDTHLSRFACYLVVQNADPSKKLIANAQTYFVVQTHRQEAMDQDFQNHGYRGLYNGLDAQDIHRRKKLKPTQHILDHMGNSELAANLFRSTQAEDKLRRENIQNKAEANAVHHEAGVIVRRAIAELGGTMPEDLPVVESIKKVERAEKKRLTAGQPKSKKTKSQD